MDGEYFTIRGATGVDLQVSLAGPGSRSYAFVIDWHIRLLVALAWLVVVMLVMYGRLTWRATSGKMGPGAELLLTLPALAIYFFYHPAFETFTRGQTPGKRIAGVRIVNREGGIPSVSAILIRNVFRLVDSLPAFYIVGLLTTILSRQRLRVGDMAAGTLLIQDERPPSTTFAGIGGGDGHAEVDIVTADLAAQILERWPMLAPDRRATIARSLLARISAYQSTPLDGMDDAALEAALTSVARGSP
jgi:uncharacterized RDD family membrane protein YckC